MHPVLRQAVDDIKALTLSAFGLLRRHWRLALAFAAVAAAAALLIHPHDLDWYHRMTDRRTEAVRRVAKLFTKWGDYQTGSLILAAALWGAGAAARRRSWQLAGLACLLAATVAGLANNTVRFTAGRPRPHAELPDRFYGPRPGRQYRSFPSGHASTSFGTASALAVAVPAVGVPALGLAGGVIWSRMYLRDHYASDVTVGSAVGILFGVAFGLAARRRGASLPA